MGRRWTDGGEKMGLLKRIIAFFRRLFGRKASVNYIGGVIPLPPKLLPQEEEFLLEKLRNGDESVRDKLIEHNLRLVVYIAQKFEKTGTSLEDLTSIGTIGLIKAIQSFDANKNIKIATYASRCIENEILMHLRKTAKTKNDISLDAPLNTDSEGNELLLADVLGSEPDALFKAYESLVETDQLKAAINSLLPREKDIMEMRYGLVNETELTQKEVADKLDISQSYISRLEKKILDKLKTNIQKQNVEV